MKHFARLLVFIHVFLLLWSGGGAIEMIVPNIPWESYTNSDFPQWLLPIHWGSVIITASGFLFGYFTHWSKTPEFMLSAYTMLFTICVIETFGFMTSSSKYVAMVGELITYSVILVLLFRHKYFEKYFRNISSTENSNPS